MKNVNYVNNAKKVGLIVPAFNVSYLPMLEPIVAAVVAKDAFAFIAVARLEWVKFESRSMNAVKDEFDKWCDPAHVRLHLDHVPVIDEDGVEVDYVPVIRQAIELGYGSVMVDGSRLDLNENIDATRTIVEMAHSAGICCEAELGNVVGHEKGPTPPYEEIFASKKYFTSVDQAQRFVKETGCDWLSVSVGNIHGAIVAAKRDMGKAEARLDLELVQALSEAVDRPLVLHGGSGIQQKFVLAAMKRGVAKINIAFANTRVYEKTLSETGDIRKAQKAVYEKTCWLLDDYFGLRGTCKAVTG